VRYACKDEGSEEGVPKGEADSDLAEAGEFDDGSAQVG